MPVAVFQKKNVCAAGEEQTLLYRDLVDKRGVLVDITLWVNDKSEKVIEISRRLAEIIEKLVDIVMDWCLFGLDSLYISTQKPHFFKMSINLSQLLENGRTLKEFGRKT